MRLQASNFGLRVVVLAAVLAIVSACAFGQVKTQKSAYETALDFAKSVGALCARHFPNRAALERQANRLAREFPAQIRAGRRGAETLARQARQKLNDLGLREKWSLALQLWEVRSSIDLMAMLSPDVLHQLTGLDVPDFGKLRGQFSQAESRLKRVLPSIPLP